MDTTLGRSTILVTNRWNRHHLSWIFWNISYIHSSRFCSHSNVPLSFPNIDATIILKHWDDCNTQINTGKGETHTSVSGFLTSIEVFSRSPLLSRHVTLLRPVRRQKPVIQYLTWTLYFQWSTAVNNIAFFFSGFSPFLFFFHSQLREPFSEGQ